MDNKKILLGKVLDSFLIPGLGRVLILDRDCSKDIQFGEMVEVNMPNSKTTTVKLLDGTMESGVKFNVNTETIVSMRVEDQGFDENLSLQGSSVFKG